jgi:hypothetical protein
MKCKLTYDAFHIKRIEQVLQNLNVVFTMLILLISIAAFVPFSTFCRALFSTLYQLTSDNEMNGIRKLHLLDCQCKSVINFSQHVQIITKKAPSGSRCCHFGFLYVQQIEKIERTHASSKPHELRSLNACLGRVQTDDWCTSVMVRGFLIITEEN